MSPGWSPRTTNEQEMGSGNGVDHFATSGNVARRSDSSPRKVLLVVLLGIPECRRGNDLGDDRTPVASRLLQPPLRRQRGCLLLRRVEEDHRPVVVADVWTLAVELGRIVVHPEDVEERVVAHPGGVVRDLDSLGVPGAMRANVLV